MFDLLNASRDVEDLPGAENLIVKAGHIKFENVSFGYQPDRLVLKNISFEILPGKTVALVSMTKGKKGW